MAFEDEMPPNCFACGSTAGVRRFALTVDGDELRLAPYLCPEHGDQYLLRTGILLASFDVRNAPGQEFERLFAESGEALEAERLRTGAEPGPAWWARWGWDARKRYDLALIAAALP